MAEVPDSGLLTKRLSMLGAFLLKRARLVMGALLASCPLLATAALVAEYRFEETAYNGTANEVADSSGNGRHGKMVGAVTSSASGKICRGIQIPKNTTNAIQAFDTGLDVNTIGNVGSISFWYKSVTSGNEHRMLFDATTSSSGKFYLYRDDDDDGVDLNFYAAESGGGTKQVDETDVLTDAVWGHVVVTWDAPGGKMRIYTNGVLRDTLSSSFSGGALNAAIDTLYIGDNRYASSAELNSANGYFDQVRIYNHELTQAQVTADMNAAPTCNTLHHMEVTSAAASGVAGASVTFTIKACANAACSTTYTGGVTGNLSITGSGMTIGYPSGAAFTIASGAATTTVPATMSPAGSSTIGLASVAPVPATSPAYCGLGVAASGAGSCTYTTTAASTLHHVELTFPASTAVTCEPIVYTVKACANADCSSLNTAGLSGSLSVSGTTVSYPSGAAFAIPGGSSSTTVSAHASTVGTATASLTGLSVTPSYTPKVFCGIGSTVPANGAGSCSVTVAESALLFAVPNHVSDVQQSITVRAVKSSSNTSACTAAYTGTKAVRFKCGYANPAVGTLPVRVGGVALNATNNGAAKCDAAGSDVNLTFDAGGQASVGVQYADVGQVSFSASSTSGMALSGNAGFTTVPASFGFSSVAAPITAGTAFTTTVTARNASGATTPNFGNETGSPAVSVALSWLRYRPTGGSASNGTFSGSGISSALTGFSNGARVVDDLIWTEVGTGDLTALMAANYLGVNVRPTPAGTTGSTGSAGAIGRFIPARLGVAVTQACSGLFTYSGQPFTATVTALNAAGNTTVNYDGTGNMTPSYAKAVTLSTATSGTFSNAVIAAASFHAGVAIVATPTFAFAAKLTEATSVVVHASDADGVSSTAGTAGSLKLRSGRLKASNFFGSEKSQIDLPVQAQYWTGRAWVLNSQDSCTLLPTSAVALSNYRNNKGGAAPGWTTSAVSSLPISAGHGKISFSAPTSDGTGSVDMALNLGGTSIDQSCLAAHPTSTGASTAWMRSQYGSSGSCALMWDRDPSARITFGVYAPESRKTIYGREAF